MERVRISKTKYYNCADMFYNEYRLFIQVTFDGTPYYRKFDMYVVANDEKEAKKIVNGYLANNITLAPTEFEDEEGMNRFIDVMYAEEMRDELQNKYIHYID